MAWCLILVILTFQSLLDVDSLLVEAELRDGRQVKGRIDKANFTFSALAVTGEIVRVQISKPPKWSKVKWICHISWEAGRQVFVVRNSSWTGELKQIWDRLNIVGNSGEVIFLEGDEIQAARFGYIASSQQHK